MEYHTKLKRYRLGLGKLLLGGLQLLFDIQILFMKGK